MVIAAYVIFPIPFSVLTMTPIYNILYIVSFRLVMGADVIRRTKAQPEQFKRYMNNLHAQILMMFVYPVYEVLFRTAQGSHYQLFVILLLPMIKVIIKNIMRKCTMHAEDMVPEAVIFTVDFFNAIYKLLIQTKLIVWMMITLCFRVMHFGVDFTFKFSGFGYKFSSSSTEE
ncbi:hypothetical protein PC122_g10028 [Phytophthora cactorum]|nr:hypothetical protein PC122_g10028 [Phytophthora cactorum]